jgi:hypothetical protein
MSAEILQRRSLRAAVVVLLATAVAPACIWRRPPATSTNPVIAWDINAQSAIQVSEAAYVTDNSFAMVSAAVYDAVNAINKTPYEPYLVAPPANGSENVDAAVATAAFTVLAWLFPAQKAQLQTKYDQSLRAIPNGAAKDGGTTVGSASAAAMIAARTNDGRYAPTQWVQGDEPGQWRFTPPVGGGDAAWLGDVKPFAIPSGDHFRMAGPPALTSAEYTADFNEEKAIGAAQSTTRTADQTNAARWWNQAPLTDWEMKRGLATSQGLNVLDTARLFAMGDVARADGHIACFNEKKYWSFWRPITAIRGAADDGNADTAPDPNWSPLLGVTPPFPDYPSGHTCASVANMVVNQFFFGRDDITISATAPGVGLRRFTSFSQAGIEVGNARVWGGIHFATASRDGRKLGTDVANYVTANFFQRR